MFVTLGIAILSACSTVQAPERVTTEKVIEYVNRQIPSAYLIRCKPRILQSIHNKSGDPKAGVFIIRKNNGTLDECIKLHDNLIDYILGVKDMPDDAKPPKPKENSQPNPTEEMK